MKVSLFLDKEHESALFDNLFEALLQSGLAPDGAELELHGPKASQSMPLHPAFPLSSGEAQPDLAVAFLDGSRHRTANLLHLHGIPKLLIGPRGLPNPIGQVTIPFEYLRKLEPWLDPLLETAKSYKWAPSLLYCDRSWVSQEIMKLADWFRLEPVKEAMKTWVNQDTLATLSEFTEAHPNVKVRTAVGPLRMLLAELGEDNIFFLGSLSSGYHLPNRHHGLNYAKLLTLSKASGLFLPPFHKTT